MGWYLGITTTRNVRLPRWAQYKETEETVTVERGEFAVVTQLQAMGFEAWCPRLIEFKRQGKRRRPDPIITPYLPGYVFVESPEERFHEVHAAQGLAQTLMAVSEAEMRRVAQFRAKVDAENDRAEKIIAANDRAAMIQFASGEALEILSGPFKDRIVKFKRMVDAAHEMHPMVEAEMDLMGSKVPVRVDPLDVKRSLG